jgi:energy-coupling factor transporter ATP-binding protein EcfA2
VDDHSPRSLTILCVLASATKCSCFREERICRGHYRIVRVARFGRWYDWFPVSGEKPDGALTYAAFRGYGLSVEARKRVTIGVELAAKPELLLFLDEPTSGLDGQSAYNIVRFLRKLTAAGQKILCTIHQPNALLFQSFDRLLLLQRGGETVYFGDIGPDSKVLIDYLEKNGAPVPSNANPAEFMVRFRSRCRTQANPVQLEAIGAGSKKRMGGGDWHQKWKNSPEFKQVLEEIHTLRDDALAKPIEEGGKKHEYATSFMFQLKTVLQRSEWSCACNHIRKLMSVNSQCSLVAKRGLPMDSIIRSYCHCPRCYAYFLAIERFTPGSSI